MNNESIEAGLTSRSLEVTYVSYPSPQVTCFYANDGAGLHTTTTYAVGDLDVRSLSIVDNNLDNDNKVERDFIDGEDLEAITGELLDELIENAKE
jgi:hypothetical protein